MTELRVKEELTGWRDEALSRRHRVWGFDAPMVDLDWIVIEYDMAKAMALIDYKRATAPWPPEDDATNASLRAIADLADRGRVPFFVVRYGIDLDWYRPLCFSNLAHKGWADFDNRKLTEYEYVTLLYKLRARTLPDRVAVRLRGHP